MDRMISFIHVQKDILISGGASPALYWWSLFHPDELCFSLFQGLQAGRMCKEWNLGNKLLSLEAQSREVCAGKCPPDAHCTPPASHPLHLNTAVVHQTNHEKVPHKLLMCSKKIMNKPPTSLWFPSDKAADLFDPPLPLSCVHKWRPSVQFLPS